jgi:hypothetical protein
MAMITNREITAIKEIKKELGKCIAKFRKTEIDKTHRICREEIILLQSEGKFNNA